MGKNYANRKPVAERPESDFYATPRSLIKELCLLEPVPKNSLIYEPASGNKVLVQELAENGYYNVVDDDIRTTGKDFLQCKEHYDVIWTNPPFSLFDEFVLKAKECADTVIFIGKTNFFGAYQRWQNGVWKNLKHVYIFNRQVDYRTSTRYDGLFHVGNLITGWFIWDKSWKEDYWTTSVMDVQKYAKLGQFKEYKDE